MIVTARTSFAHHGFVAFDRDGHDQFIAVIKATYQIQTSGELVVADEQIPVFHADQFRGEPARSSIRYEADLASHKPGVDVLINGTAYARSPVQQLFVEFQFRQIRKRLLVTGDRVWLTGAFGARVSSPRAFTEMPIVFERAFGGTDIRTDRATAELRNPIGRGFCQTAPEEGTPLPNIELPSQPISSWKDRPHPAGFGVVGRGWQPRIARAGTYDENWRMSRFPLLPADFDDAHFLAAPDDQVLDELNAQEPLVLRNLTPDPELRIVIPSLRVPVFARWNQRTKRLDATPDTIIVEPDDRRVMLVCRLALPFGPKVNRLREVIVGELSRGEERAVLTGKRYLPLHALTPDTNGENTP